MGLTRRAVTTGAWLGLAALAVMATLDAATLMRAADLNAAIAGGAAPADAPDAVPEVRFARAHALAASGAGEAALSRYATLQGDSALARAARYNSANLLLREAAALRERAQSGQALALIELAKETYREVLRADPDDWPARYNLERAQRIVPDPDAADEAPPDVDRNAERAATTMRGYSPGLP